MSATIIFDFDGTVAVGNGPVLAYAREAARGAGGDLLARLERELAAFEAGEPGRFRDGYDVVGTLADDAGVAADQRQRAYLASRAALGTPDAEPAAAAPGLADLLGALPEAARVVLVTNAPESGVDAALRAWGVRDRFDELVFDAGKPAGLSAIVARALETGPVLSIGDIVENDLAPARALGADTALVGATAATASEPVTFRAQRLVELIDPIVSWARAAELASPSVPAASPTPKGPAHA